MAMDPPTAMNTDSRVHSEITKPAASRSQMPKCASRDLPSTILFCLLFVLCIVSYQGVVDLAAQR